MPQRRLILNGGMNGPEASILVFRLLGIIVFRRCLVLFDLCVQRDVFLREGVVDGIVEVDAGDVDLVS